ncbi:tryptophan synthase subunit alpha [Candidatus Nitrospira neomarina]|uniref:Tryptophan synthase alpha chain n=1 Tax=Candidatus Nitrospira neomarina TaxID=3020899 RepID=A0AA96GLT8_9BACT|nr:tryptophan synthase subunit alpha [Candidatus Nitrospira neomarina]WNM63182.1 tryptophan synthase subunit alpha [Candidatus Nitrospira neomarina]
MSNRIQATFAQLHSKGKKALIPYIMAGDPTLAMTESLVLALEQGGADLIELGVPFSDPIADGPVIQQAAERALHSGTTLKNILATVANLRKTTSIPLILMTYYNSLMAMGIKDFCANAVDAGVDGLIVPDLPPEESDLLYHATQAAGGPVSIFLLAPTSTAERRRAVIKRSHGFIYYVSLTGITGAKLTDLSLVRQSVQQLQRASRKPVAVGFGIASPEQAREVGQFADGVIVGSALVRYINEHHSAQTFLTDIQGMAQQWKSVL